MSSSQGVKIAVGVGLAVLLIGLYTRTGRQPPENPATDRNDQVERRLQQLRETHDRPGHKRAAAGNQPEGGRIDARSNVTPDPHAAPSRQRPAGKVPQPEANAADSTEPADADADMDLDDVTALKNIAVKDHDPERRLAAISMLGSSEDPEVLPTLAQALSDEDDEVRMAAIQSLSDFTGDVPIDLLSKVASEDPSADNRYEALEALSDIGGDRAASAIQKALSDPDEDVRSLAEGIVDMEDTYQGDGQPTVEAPTPGAPH